MWRFKRTYSEPAQASLVVFGLVFKDAVAFEIQEKVLAVGFVWCDVKDQEVEHGDESEAFVELGERFQDP